MQVSRNRKVEVVQMNGTEFPVLFVSLPFTLLAVLIASLLVVLETELLNSWVRAFAALLILFGGWGGNLYLVIKSHSLWMDRK